MKSLKELLEEHENQIPSDLVEALEKMKGYKEQMDALIEETKTNLKSLSRQMENPLKNVIEYSNLLINESNLSKEKEEDYLNQINEKSKQFLEIVNIAHPEKIGLNKDYSSLQTPDISTEKYQGKVPPELIKTLKEMQEYKQQTDTLVEETKTNLRFFGHEMKNPLNAMIGYSDLLTQVPNLSEEKKTKYLKHINTSSKQFSNIVNFVNPEIASAKEKISLERIAKDTNSPNELYMRDNEIGLNMRYSPVQTN